MENHAMPQSFSRLISAFFCLLVLSSAVAHADAPEDLGPAIGSLLPHDLKAVDQYGTPQNADTLMGEKGMLLVFFRSADWCPYCKKQLIDLNSQSAAFSKAGYPLIGISYDSPKSLLKFTKKRGIDYTLLSDPGSDIIKAFELLNQEIRPGSRAFGIPYPAMIVVSRERIISQKFHEKSYKNRPDQQKLLEILRE